MATFAEDIEKVAGDEPIEAVSYRGSRSSWRDDGEQVGPVAWAEARTSLDYDYDDGFGGTDCYPLWAWTPTRVLFVGTYDGSTWIESVPRNPSPPYGGDCDGFTETYPTHVGGG